MSPSIASPILVVGGTGFIGSHLVERLAAGGASVRVAARRAAWPWGETPRGVAFHAVDVADSSSYDRLAGLAEGACSVVNLAGALFKPGVPPGRYRALNAEGAARVAAAARAAAESAAGRASRAGARPVRLVHVGTAGVLGPTGAARAEEDEAPRPTTPYESTKLEGERGSLAARGDGLEVVIVRPGLVYGPRDLHLLGLYRAIAAGVFRLIDGGRARWQPVFVEDAARAIAAAIVAEGADGGIFHIAGAEETTFEVFAGRIAAALGTRVRGPSLPRGAAMLAGLALEGLCRPFGVEPPLSRSRVRTMTENRLFSIGRARRVLGFEPAVSLEAGLARTIAWYKEGGYLG